MSVGLLYKLVEKEGVPGAKPRFRTSCKAVDFDFKLGKAVAKILVQS